MITSYIKTLVKVYLKNNLVRCIDLTLPIYNHLECIELSLQKLGGKERNGEGTRRSAAT